MAKRIDDLLRRAQVPQPSAPPSPPEDVCPKCKGAGFIAYDVPFGHPWFGRAVPCDCLMAQREEKDYAELQELSNLFDFRDKTFDSFNSHAAGVADAFRAARDYAQDPQGWLVFVGPVGCGKTHLAAAIANQCLADGGRPFFVNVPELLDHLRSTFAPGSSATYDERFEEVRTAQLLILDDLGTESSSEWAREKIYQIFNRRYNTRAPTVVTMNPREYDRLDERVKSRLNDAVLSRVILMKEASDYRGRKARRPGR
jgi:DNA replication protein DnaC